MDVNSKESRVPGLDLENPCPGEPLLVWGSPGGRGSSGERGRESGWGGWEQGAGSGGVRRMRSVPQGSPGMGVSCREWGCPVLAIGVPVGWVLGREWECPAGNVGALPGMGVLCRAGQGPHSRDNPPWKRPCLSSLLPQPPPGTDAPPWEAPEVVLFSPNPCFPWDFGIRAVPVLGSSEP